jgi:short subunit dehydrogenase-like uncharacterized protein
MEKGTVAVVGATGFTGRLVVAALRKRGVQVRTIGRNRQKLDALAAANPGVQVRAVEWTAADIADALRGCAAMVSCAGPFIQAGHPVAEAAVRARVPYTDSTGEQPFIRWIFEELAQPARAAGVPLIPAAGFDYLPGDLGAALVAQGMGPLERLDVVYAVESGATTRGTRLSALGIAAAESLSLQDGTLRPMRVGALRRAVEAPWGRVIGALIPGGEPLQVPRHVDVATVHGYLAVPGAMGPSSPGAGLFASALRLPGAVGLVQRLARNGPEGPDDKQRQARVAVHVQASARDGGRRALLLEARDAYGFTAESLAELAVRLAGGIDATGPCAPAEVVDPAGFLAATGFSVREVSPEA